MSDWGAPLWAIVDDVVFTTKENFPVVYKIDGINVHNVNGKLCFFDKRGIAFYSVEEVVNRAKKMNISIAKALLYSEELEGGRSDNWFLLFGGNWEIISVGNLSDEIVAEFYERVSNSLEKTQNP